MSGFSAYMNWKSELSKAVELLSSLTGIDKVYLLTMQLNSAEVEAIEIGIFIPLPVIKTENGYYTKLSNCAHNHYTDLKIENGYFYVGETKYIIDPMFFDEDSIRKWCKKKNYDIN